MKGGWVCGSRSRTGFHAILEESPSKEDQGSGARAGLEAYTTDNHPVGGAHLVFQEKIAFE
jgi:hypothetical protein